MDPPSPARPIERLPEYVERVLETVAEIPAGRVVTYGQLARLLGSGGARTVGTVLARYGSDVPWWRVVRAGGHPPSGLQLPAREQYLREGTPLLGTGLGEYRIDMSRARWDPNDAG